MRPLRVAVVGSGPAGMYSIEHLLERRGLAVEVDLYERLPTPWGLVRAGVAPDHPEKKLVTDRHFDYLLKDARVRFIGNVEVGRDVGVGELAAWYDAVIYAIGASGDVRMAIPGEELPGCWAAREFVSFYNGHPDYSHLRFDLSCERALIVGNGNVALDVARILTMPVRELERTDIADQALAALRGSEIREVVILGRRGSMQAAFHNPEFEELEHLEGVDVLVQGEALSELHGATLTDADWEIRRKVATLRRLAERAASPDRKRIVLRFLGSPVELLGPDRVRQVRIASNRLVCDAQGGLQAHRTGQTSTLEAGLVLRAIGYRGLPFPGLPFDERCGVIRNRQGRIVEEDGRVLRGAYVTGWIKRGCRGLIGSNRKCGHETVERLIEDMEAGHLGGESMEKAEVLSLVRQLKQDQVSLGGWLTIDRTERDAGRAQHRPRVKLSNTAALVAAARSRPNARSLT